MDVEGTAHRTRKLWMLWNNSLNYKIMDVVRNNSLNCKIMDVVRNSSLNWKIVDVV